MERSTADTPSDPPPIPPKKRERGQHSPRQVIDEGGDYDHLQQREQQTSLSHGGHMTKSSNGIADTEDYSYSHLGPSPKVIEDEVAPRVPPLGREAVTAHPPDGLPRPLDSPDDESSESGHLPTAWTHPSQPPPLPPKPASISPPKSGRKQFTNTSLSVSGATHRSKRTHRNSYEQFKAPLHERPDGIGLQESGESRRAGASTSESASPRLITPSMEQRQRQGNAYEVLGPYRPGVEDEEAGEDVRGAELHRTPSLEWDSADLPLSGHSPRSAQQVQESWQKDHEARQRHSYAEITIPKVQQKWIEEHDRSREQRFYEEVDYNWSFHSPAAAQPSSKPKGGDKGKRKKQALSESALESVSSTLERQVEGINQALPEGWEAEVSHGQIIYWHIPTGKIQFVPPTGKEPNTSTFSDDDTTGGSEDIRAIQEMVAKKQGLRVVGVYLGWVEVESLGPHEGLSDLCGRCITSVVGQRRLSACEDGDDVEEGQKVYLEVRGNKLKVVDHLKRTLICKQRLVDIRVFGISSNNERDFGYIVYDSELQLHKCQVFRVNSPAQSFLGSLLNSAESLSVNEQQEWDNTVKATLQEQRLRHLSGHSSTPSSREKTPSADELDEEEEEELVSSFSHTEDSYSYQRFECIYMGNTAVPEAFGMHMVNDALVQLSEGTARWMAIYLDISPQCIKLIDKDASNLSFTEHRVRFISFLGIGADERMCGYVLDCGDSCYQCYGFQMEPTSEKLCLALHRACRERFERVLQVHPEARVVEDEIRKRQSSHRQSWISRLWGSKKGPSQDVSSSLTAPQEEESLVDTLRRFSVYYLGSQLVASSSSTDEVVDAVQALSSTGPSGGKVQLEVSPSNLTLYDPNKLWYKRRTFSARNVSYLVGKDKHLAFVVAEGSGASRSYKCHVLTGAEFEVDARSIVSTIQNAFLSDTSRQ